MDPGLDGTVVRAVPNGAVVVGGTLDDVAHVEVFDADGTPLWSFDHDAPVGPAATVILDLAPVDDTALLGLASPNSFDPGHVFLLDLGSQDVTWTHYVDDSFVDYPTGPTGYFSVSRGLRVAASAAGHLALLISGDNFGNHHVILGLDPDTGERTWLDSQFADFFWSSGLQFNDAGGWLTHVSSYSAVGAAGHRTRRVDPDTGAVVESPSGPGGAGVPGSVAGPIAIRPDGVLVVPLRENTPIANTLEIVTQDLAGDSAGSIGVPASPPTVRAVSADGDARVYMLVSGVRVERLNPDVSMDLVHEPPEGTSLRGLSTTVDGGVVVLGDDGVDFIEQFCAE